MEIDSDIRESADQPGQASRRVSERLRSSMKALCLVSWQRLPKLFQWNPAQAAKLRVEVSASEIILFNPSQKEPVTRLRYHDNLSMPVLRDESSSACELILNNELGLVTTITFPEEAEAMLGSLIGIMLGRYIPFREEEIHFDYRVSSRDRAKGEIDVKIYAVPRATLERVLEHLTGLGLNAVTVDISESSTGGSSVRAGVNLLRQVDEDANLPRRKFNRALILAALLILITAATIPVYQHYFPAQHQKEFKNMRMPPRDSERLHDDANGSNGTLRINRERARPTPQNVSI